MVGSYRVTRLVMHIGNFFPGEKNLFLLHSGVGFFYCFSVSGGMGSFALILLHRVRK